MTEDNAPRRRASDDNRSATVEELSAALSRGQLTLAEFDERSSLAWSARYVDELRPLLADVTDSPSALPAHLDPHRPAPHHDPTSQAVARVSSQISGHQGGSPLSMSVMGGAERAGNWLCPSNHTSITVMGGNLVDLREASFESGSITIKAFALMGGIEVIVPEGVRVICDGFGLMGGFGSTVDKKATVPPSSLPRDAPVVKISGLAVMGGVSVVTKPRE
ncbi:hypothetical protein CFAEC_02080 [Corynebacterium faecale]|nr:hypothetical protein CFAEC_02080 [Corynebacterium faecale]